MNSIESEFGFDEYIMPTTYSTLTKMESFDAQLYPSGKVSQAINKSEHLGILTFFFLIAFGGYYGENNGFDMNQPVMMTNSSYDMYTQSPPSVVASTPIQGSSSPESMSSRLSPATVTTPLLSPHHHTTITEKIANVNKLPESFLPEFHQYSKETYENGTSNNKKRRRTHSGQKKSMNSDDDNKTSSSSDEDIDSVSAQEVRRQIHIQSEQKRRAQIKDGFEELRQHLPGCVNKKMSKAALLHRSKWRERVVLSKFRY